MRRVRRAGALTSAVLLVMACTPSAVTPSIAPTSAASPAASAQPAASHASPAPMPSPEPLGAIAIGERLDPAPMAFPGSSPSARALLIDVAEAGGRLRATLELSNRDDCVELVLLDPAGITVAPGAGDYPVVCPHEERSGQSFVIESAAEPAGIGTWRVEVRALDPRDLVARLRITLELMEATPAVAEGELRYPDLVPWLPWEFGFAAPDSADPGTARDRDNGPGDPTLSCHPEEEPDDTQCLRFSAGVDNIGDGPMAVVFRDDAAYQHVYRLDATPRDYADDEAERRFDELDAGRGEWHPFHQHRHLADFVLYELFLVRDDEGTLARLDTGGKHGYCTFSQQLADWTSIGQDPQYASFPDGAYCDAAMTLERGWGDLYRWQRPGQYLDYDRVAEPDGSMRAGRYVVRVTVDPEDHIAESSEANNVGYALIEVMDGGGPGLDSVVMCEQGFGSDPWDPDGAIAEDRAAWVRGVADPGLEPRACS